MAHGHGVMESRKGTLEQGTPCKAGHTCMHGAWDGIMGGGGAYPDLIILTEEEDDIHALQALVEIESRD